MEVLVKDWRDAWSQGRFPFLYPQLASYGTLALDPNAPPGIAAVREAQLQNLSIPNAGMAATIDIGDAGDIHPKNKQALGRRLGLIARAPVYGENLPYSGPIYDSMTVQDNTGRCRRRSPDATRGFSAA